MVEVIIVGIVVLFYMYKYVIKFFFIALSHVVKCWRCFCFINQAKVYKDENGNKIYLINWGDGLIDYYGNKYVKKSSPSCNIF